MRKNVVRDIQIQQFIVNYLKREFSADRFNAGFHDEFSAKFGGKRIIYPFGSCPNLLAMKWLKRLYEQGILDRGRVGLIAHEVGFPNWAYVYTLSAPNMVSHPTLRMRGENGKIHR